ncbi:unnamed protein product [Caenorhabditis angaria]|uniref:t-SNARE coiled-coil homology domain-containing protein n=1 Tax=Caenorhabditis angaria TaxID=860376 RepID=A0A9P1J5K5_9PELO|nr:unnamed protein product [Caenorhabditis angaria]
MVRKTFDEIPEPIVFPSEETINRRIKLKLIDFDSEIAKLNMQSLESTRHMLQDLDQMNNEGFRTLAALEDQDEQLDKIEEHLTTVNKDLNVVSDNVNDMEHYCGCSFFKLLCAPIKCLRKKRERDQIKEEVLEHMANSMSNSSGEKEAVVTFRSSNKRRESSANGEFMKRLTNDTIEEEIERNMMQLDQGLESIKHLAVDMHVQLKIQEPKLDRIEELTETNDIVVEGVNDKVRKLLH